MKKIVFLLILSAFFSCEGSDDYQGHWKAMDTKGNKYEISFSPNSFSIKDSTGKSNSYTYTQNAFKHENATDTYGIRLEDGRGYQIYFPKNDQSVGLMMDENGVRQFTISRKEYVTYQDIYKLN